MNMSELPEIGLLSTPDAAQRLGVSRQNLHNLVKRRELSAAVSVLGRAQSYFYPADIDALKRKRETPPPPREPKTRVPAPVVTCAALVCDGPCKAISRGRESAVCKTAGAFALVLNHKCDTWRAVPEGELCTRDERPVLLLLFVRGANCWAFGPYPVVHPADRQVCADLLDALDRENEARYANDGRKGSGANFHAGEGEIE